MADESHVITSNLWGTTTTALGTELAYGTNNNVYTTLSLDAVSVTPVTSAVEKDATAVVTAADITPSGSTVTLGLGLAETGFEAASALGDVTASDASTVTQSGFAGTTTLSNTYSVNTGTTDYPLVFDAASITPSGLSIGAEGIIAAAPATLTPAGKTLAFSTGYLITGFLATTSLGDVEFTGDESSLPDGLEATASLGDAVLAYDYLLAQEGFEATTALGDITTGSLESVAITGFLMTSGTASTTVQIDGATDTVFLFDAAAVTPSGSSVGALVDLAASVGLITPTGSNLTFQRTSTAPTVFPAGFTATSALGDENQRFDWLLAQDGFEAITSLDDVTVSTGEWTDYPLSLTAASITPSGSGLDTEHTHDVEEGQIVPTMGTLTLRVGTRLYPTGFGLTADIGDPEATTSYTGAVAPVDSLLAVAELGDEDVSVVANVTILVTGFTVTGAVGTVSFGPLDATVTQDGLRLITYLGQLSICGIWVTIADVQTANWTAVNDAQTDDWLDLNIAQCGN